MPITSPRPLDHLLAVANSYHEPEARDVGSTDGAHWIPAHDHLDSSETAVEFLSRMGIRLGIAPTRSHLDRLRLVRQAARALLTSPLSPGLPVDDDAVDANTRGCGSGSCVGGEQEQRK